MYAFISLILLSFSVSAQNSWKICVNNKVVLSAAAEDESSNNKRIGAADWKKDGSLEIAYKEIPVNKSLIRSIILVDENDNELFRKNDVSSLKIPLRELKTTAAGKNKIRIFTIAIPRDPELAARVRVRRVHLCTLELN